MKHCFLALVGWMMVAVPIPSAAPPFIEVQVQTDRSALWVGDRFHEIVTIVHDPQVRFVTDNLQEATVNLEPFEILDLQYHESPAAEGRQKLEIVFLLTTYEAAARELEIPSFNLFYFVEGASAVSTDRTAESLTVPAATVVLQSTIPENVSSIRDTLSPPVVPFRYGGSLPLALGMLALAIACAAPLFLHGKRLRKEQELLRRRKAALDQLRSGAADLVSRPVGSERQMAEFYEETNRRLRDYLSAILAVPSEGKSPRELSAYLEDGKGAIDGLSNEQGRQIVAILEACERVRYAPNEFLVGTEMHSKLTDRLRILAQG